MNREKWEIEFDERFLSNGRAGNERDGFYWCLNTLNSEEIKQFIQDLLDQERAEIREMIEKMKIKTPKGATIEAGDFKVNQVLEDILKHLK